ncbi:MAG: hypothetical protein H6728_15920 [Myxococcales bacterium]|nr:hypothetical protein [Myxococcales bacterium]MCB9644561.1 hypothetical protein [Myxococcales bacterium]
MKRLIASFALLLMTGCGIAEVQKPLNGTNQGANICVASETYQPTFPTADSGIKECYQKCMAWSGNDALCKPKCDKTPPLRFEAEVCFGECILVGCENNLTCGEKCFQSPHKYAPRDTCVNDCVLGGLGAGLCENKCYQIDPSSYVGSGMTCVERCLGDAGKQEPCERACAQMSP